MIVYGYETAGPDCGMFIYHTVDEVLDVLRDEIESSDLFPGEIEMTVHILDMTQEQLDNLETLED